MSQENFLSRNINYLWVVIWLAIVISNFSGTTVLVSEDFLRYLGVSWHMLSEHQYLLPRINGMPYSDKPPLLFWLIAAGWRALGISLWWPQILVALIGIANIVLTQTLAKAFWPDQAKLATFVPVILLGTYLWAFTLHMLRVDMLLIYFSLLGMLAVWRWLNYQRYAIPMLLVALVGGGLSKGPIIFLYTLLPTTLACFTIAEFSEQKKRMLLGVWASSLVALGLCLLWALPAAKLGGEHYSKQIAFQQILHRVTEAEHNKYFWYLLRLPFWLLPWSVYPPFWRAVRKHTYAVLDPAGLFCLLIIAINLVTFSLFPQKETWYLCPLIPIFVMIIARALSCGTHESLACCNRDLLPTTIGLVFLLLLITVGPHFIDLLPRKLAARGQFLKLINPMWSVIPVAFLLLRAFINPKQITSQVIYMAGLGCAFALLFGVAIAPAYLRYSDYGLLAKAIQAEQAQQHPVAFMGQYGGYYDYIGRIQQPLTNLGDLAAVTTWAQQHPAGSVVINSNCLTDQAKAIAPNLWHRRYNGGEIVGLWSAQQLNTLTRLQICN